MTSHSLGNRLPGETEVGNADYITDTTTADGQCTKSFAWSRGSAELLPSALQLFLLDFSFKRLQVFFAPESHARYFPGGVLMAGYIGLFAVG